MRKRVAIILQGGIGGGAFSQGCPPIVNIVNSLSIQYELTVYSILPANPDFSTAGFNFRSPNRKIKWSKVRTLLTCLLILQDHLQKRFHLVHAFWAYPAGTISVILGKIFRIPSLITIQGGEATSIKELNYGNMLNPTIRKITLWTCDHATRLNSVSTFLLKNLTQYGLKRKDGIVIPFGADGRLFVNSVRSGSEILRIIHVANLTEVKDQLTLLKTFELIIKSQPAKLKIIGGDFMNGRLHQFVDEMKLREQVEMVGAIRNTDLVQYYNWADIMIHTSLHEGLPSVAAEAMACGVVVCATRVGIFDDLGDSYFVTAKVGDHGTLAQQAVNLWKDKRRFEELKRKSTGWAQKFDLAWTVSEFGKVYEKMTEC